MGTFRVTSVRFCALAALLTARAAAGSIFWGWRRQAWRASAGSQGEHRTWMQRFGGKISETSQRAPLSTLSLTNQFSDPGLQPQCLPPGRLIFAHVMKTAGLSVDDYLKCRCVESHCSIARNEGSRGIDGDSRCPPAVCSAHYPVGEMGQICGRQFSNARVFTLLRDPVDRVVSLFHYVRTPRPEDNWVGFVPYMNKSLEQVLVAYGKEDWNNWRRGPGYDCSFCAKQLSNGMVLHHFASDRALALRSTWATTNGVLRVPRAKDLEEQLEEAKKVLERMDRIFFDVRNFKDYFESDDLLTGGSSRSSCSFPHINPTKSFKAPPTERELQLIYDLNSADIELYEYAKKLPNARL